MLYSKNGSIPKTETDGTPGWVEVPEPPIPPEGMEVVWWCPPGWVVRPPKPVEPGYFFDWNQSKEQWIRIANEPDLSETIAIGSASDTISTTSGSDTVGV